MDPYLDQEAGCLRNLLNIKDRDQLAQIESNLSTIRIVELDRSIIGNFDLEHLQAIHRYIFQDLYDWAGEIRHYGLSKGSTTFMPPSIIHQGGAHLFQQLAREQHLKGLEAERFSDRAGYYLGEINHLHPFREGNGRTQRTFLNQLAHQNNYHIAWDKMTQKEMIEALIESDTGSHQPIAQLIRRSLQDREYDQIAAQYADKMKIQAAKPSQSYHGRIIDVTARYVVQEAEPGQIVLHNKRALSKVFESPLERPITISYPHGQAGLVSDDRFKSNREPEKFNNRQDYRRAISPDHAK